MSTTFSPDSIHGGPSIATLSGTCSFNGAISALDRGDVFYINYSGKAGVRYSFSFDKAVRGEWTGRIAIAAEAVTLTHNQLHHHGIVHIPVVVFGRTVVNLKHNEDQNQKFYGGDIAWISNNDLKVHSSIQEGYQITFLHPEEDIPSKTFTKKGTPTEVFVEPFYFNIINNDGDETDGSDDSSEYQAGDYPPME